MLQEDPENYVAGKVHPVHLGEGLNSRYRIFYVAATCMREVTENEVDGLGGANVRLPLPDRNLTSTTQRTSTAPRCGQADRRPGYFSKPIHEELLKWIDKDYYEENPWYGKHGQNLIFSLGKPLPRKVRRPKRARQDNNKSREALSEEGQANLHQNGSHPLAEHESNVDNRNDQDRMIDAGASHNKKTNDADQPVFEYAPGEQDNDNQWRGGNGESLDFKIDSEHLGQREADDVGEGDRDPNEYRNWWARLHAKHPEPLAEFTAVSFRSNCHARLGNAISSFVPKTVVAVFLGLAGTSPCGVLAYGVYADAIHEIDPTMENMSETFSTPQTWVRPGTAFLNQAVGSAVMLIAVFALSDDQNNPPGAGMHAFIILGLLVATLKFSLGWNIGSAFNPASDFGPRVIAYAVAYREDNIFRDPWWLYGPWVATLVGSFIGRTVYDSSIFVGSESRINY
ncbi:aquaporin-like protein [Bisporella sp. PMI_857]|nr:aquaporin-like protein [Bisporella sp. PMI_857]